MEEITEKCTQKPPETIDYEFNLDGIEDSENYDQSEQTHQSNVEDQLKIDEPIKSIADLIRDKLTHKPKLSGGPDDVIDLEHGVIRPSDVRLLADRFFQHTSKIQPLKHTVELKLVTCAFSNWQH